MIVMLGTTTATVGTTATTATVGITATTGTVGVAKESCRTIYHMNIHLGVSRLTESGVRRARDSLMSPTKGAS